MAEAREAFAPPDFFPAPPAVAPLVAEAALVVAAIAVAEAPLPALGESFEVFTRDIAISTETGKANAGHSSEVSQPMSILLWGGRGLSAKRRKSCLIS